MLRKPGETVIDVRTNTQTGTSICCVAFGPSKLWLLRTESRFCSQYLAFAARDGPILVMRTFPFSSRIPGIDYEGSVTRKLLRSWTLRPAHSNVRSPWPVEAIAAEKVGTVEIWRRWRWGW